MYNAFGSCGPLVVRRGQIWIKTVIPLRDTRISMTKLPNVEIKLSIH